MQPEDRTRAPGVAGDATYPARPSAVEGALQVHTLGGFRAERDGKTFTWRRSPASTVLKMLLIAHQHRLSRERLAAWLRPDDEPEKANTELSQALHWLRQSLEPERQAHEPSSYILQVSPVVILGLRPHDWVDLLAFRSALVRARNAADPIPHLEAAVALYGGELFPEEGEAPWCVAERDRLHRLWAGALLELADLHAAAGRVGDVMATLERLLTADATQEEGARRLIGLLGRQGRRPEALRLYQRLQDALEEEMGIAPAPETAALAAALRAGEPLSLPEDTVVPSPELVTALRRGRTPLVGRTMQMEQLRAALLRVRAGRGGALLLTGDAGIGKTRLVEEAAMVATALGFTVLWGQATEDEQTMPYIPVTAALRTYLRVRPTKAVRQEVPQSAVLGALLPELAGTGHGAPATLDAAGAERLRLWEAVRALVAAAARSQPVLLVVEDLHWADEASLGLVPYLVRRSGDLRLFTLMTVRDEEVSDDHPLHRFILEGQRTGLVEVMPVPALTSGEVADLARERLGWPLSDDQAAALHRQSGGNPFFAGELLALLAERAGESALPPAEVAAMILGGGLPLPRTIRQTLAQRLRRVSPTCRALLQVMAVLGDGVRENVLARALQPEEPGWPAARDEAVVSGLLHRDADLTGGGQSSYSLAHALLRRTLDEELLPTRRQRLHFLAAVALAEDPSRPDEERVEAIAAHFSRTEAHGEAAHWLERAGDRAATVFANEAALTHYRAARERVLLGGGDSTVLSRLDEKAGNLRLLVGDLEGAQEDFARARAEATAAGESPDRRAELWRKEASTWEKRGDYVLALEALERTEQEADTARGESLTPRVAAAIELSRGDVFHRMGRYDDAAAAAERAKALLNGERPEGAAGLALARAELLSGNVAFERGAYPRAEECYRRSLELHGQIADQTGMAACWNNLGNVALAQGELAEAEERYRRALAIRERIGDHAKSGGSWNSLGLLALEQGDLTRAEEYHRRGLAILESIGDQKTVAHSLHNLSTVLMHRGELNQAEELERRGLAIMEVIGDQQGIAAAWHSLGLLAFRRGDLTGAEGWYLRSQEHAQSIGYDQVLAHATVILGDVACERGELDSAASLYRRGRRLARHDGTPDIEALAALGLARVSLREVWRRGRTGASVASRLHVAEVALRYAQSLVRVHSLTMLSLPAELLWAELRLYQGAAGEARKLADDAVGSATAGHRRWEEGVGRRLVGQCALALRENDAAQDALRTALVIFDTMGAPLEAARTRLALAALLTAPPTYAVQAGTRSESASTEARMLLADARARFAASATVEDLSQADQLVTLWPAP